MTIKLTSIFVHDPVAAHKFYTEVLGFVSVMLMPEAYLAIVASPEDPKGTALMLEPNTNPIAKTYQDGLYQSNIPVMTFGTENLDEDYEKLKSRGVVFRREPKRNEWGYDTIFEDTFGNLVQLHQS